MPDARGSVRFRVTALSTAVVVVVLAVAGGILLVVQQRRLTENLRDAIEQRADDVAAALRAGTVDPRPAGGGEDIVVQIVEGTSVVAASAVLADQPPFAATDDRGRDVWRTVAALVPGGERGLLLTRVVTSPDATVTLHVGGSLGDTDEAERALTQTLVLLVPGVALLLAGATWQLVGRTLSPVEAIRREVASIGGRPEGRRVPQPKGDDEVARLAATMNGMLDRVQAAQQVQDRFIADASHELRTPVTRMRTELEVELRSAADDRDRLAYRSVLDETQHLQRLIDDLLELARHDGGVPPSTTSPVDLDDLVFVEADRLRAVGGPLIDVAGVSAAQTTGEARALARAIANLADNAARYATSTVRFAVQETGGWAEVTVVDDGPGIPADQAETVFERFTRLDASRSTDGGGTGLGLAIARGITERHGGTLAVDTTHTRGARLVMRLPLTSASMSARDATDPRRHQDGHP